MATESASRAASCPVCSRSFQPRTLAGAWVSVSHHLQQRRRQGCPAHSSTHNAVYRHGGRTRFGCPGCEAVFPSIAAVFTHLACAQDETHNEFKVAEIRIPQGVDGVLLSGRRRNTHLYNAANQGDVDATRALLSHGANPNYSSGTDAITPLMTAAEGGFSEILRSLLATGVCNVNQQNVYGQTALGFAAQNGQVDAVEVLLAHPGVDIELLASGYNAAQLARRAGHVQIADRIAALMRERQVELVGQALRSAASTLYDTPGDRIFALFGQLAVNLPDSIRGGHGVADDDPEGFYGVPQCEVCMNKEASSALVPCFHACFCEACAAEIIASGSGCAICRRPVDRAQRLYF